MRNRRRGMTPSSDGTMVTTSDPPNTALFTRLYSIQHTLRLTFGLVPIVAGLDKFANLLTHWVDYLWPALANRLPVGPEIFMRIVGVIEIVAGFLVLTMPRVGAIIVGLWLFLIAITLFLSGRYLDVGGRDVVMGIAAICLARLVPVVGDRTR